jgi:hypothetical protein
MTNFQINQIFSSLDAWRHLPAYQLERRADIFFSVYLAEVLKKKFDLSEAPILIPEFPIRYGLIPELKGSAGENQSFKIDYLAITKDGENAYFVELKTDMTSRNPEQDDKMRKAAEMSTSKLFSGIECMLQNSNQKQKYRSLFRYISALLNLDISPDGVISEATFAKFKAKPKVIYLQPAKSTNEDDIDFEYFAKEISSQADHLAQRFADSLMKWAGSKAGAPQ